MLLRLWFIASNFISTLNQGQFDSRVVASEDVFLGGRSRLD